MRWCSYVFVCLGRETGEKQKRRSSNVVGKWNQLVPKRAPMADEAANDRTRLCRAKQQFVMPAGGVRRDDLWLG
jgi:hypothetical protein